MIQQLILSEESWISLTLFILPILMLVYFIMKKIILPYKKYLFYRKYGKGEFTPIIGEFFIFNRSLKQNDDMDYQHKHIFDDDQEQRVYVVNQGSAAKLRLIEPEILKEFFLKQDYYVKNEDLIDNIKRLVNEGIITAEGSKWKSSRRIFSKAFHFDYLQGFSGKIEENSRRVFDQLISTNQLTNVNMIDKMQQITGSIIILSFFGETLEGDSFKGMSIISALSHALGSLGNQVFTLYYFMFGKRFFELGLRKQDSDLVVFLRDLKVFIRGKLSDKIAQIQEEVARTGKTEQQSILAQLIISKQIDEISREQLFEDFLTFYLAGMDTTGHLVGMIVYYLTQNKDIYVTLKKEIDENKDESANGLAHLPYLNAVIKEALRYYGPANFIFDRVAVKDHELGEIPIKKGTIVTPYPSSPHRNPKYFENPHIFDPSRWLNKNAKDVPNFAYIPFSAGSRNCIGQHLANLESRSILNTFIKTFDFSSPADYQLKMKYTFLPGPLEPMRINLTLRKKVNQS